MQHCDYQIHTANAHLVTVLSEPLNIQHMKSVSRLNH